MAYRRMMADLLASTPGLASPQAGVIGGGLGRGTVGRWAATYGAQGSVGDRGAAVVRGVVLRPGAELEESVALQLGLGLLELGRLREAEVDREAVARAVLGLRAQVEEVALLPETAAVHAYLDAVTADLVRRVDAGVDAGLVTELLRGRLGPAELPAAAIGLAGFSVEVLLRDADRSVRESVRSAEAWDAPAMLASLIPLGYAALDLAGPAAHGTGVRDRLAAIDRAWNQRMWPSNRDLPHPAMTRAARSLRDVATLLDLPEAEQPAGEGRREPTVEAVALRCLHVATYATRSAVTAYVEAERAGHTPGPAMGVTGLRWIERLDAFERLLESQVVPTAAAMTPSGRAPGRMVRVGVGAALEAWSDAVDGAVRRHASPATLALIAQVQAMVVETVEHLLPPGGKGRTDAARRRAVLHKNAERSRTAWQHLAVSWTRAGDHRTPLDHTVSDTAITLREACFELTHTGRRFATRAEIAAKPGVVEATDALVRCLARAPDVAADLEHAVMAPRLGPGVQHQDADVRHELAEASEVVVRRSHWLAALARTHLSPAPGVPEPRSHALQRALLATPHVPPRPALEPADARAPVPTR